MITRPSPGATVAFLAALLVAASAFVSCSDSEDPVNPGDRLCGGEAGIGLSITGRAQPVEFCLDDDDVTTTYSTGESRYDIIARLTVANDIFEVQMVFRHDPTPPASLNITGDLAAAAGDPNSVWIYYQEIPNSGQAIESVAATGGRFTLGVNDDSVVTGTLEGVVLTMENVSDGQPAGTRVFDEGFFSLLTEVQP
jgi:hypothetical protein